MSISPRSTCWWSSALALVGVVALAVGQSPQKSQTVPPFLEEFQTSKPRDLPLFLDEFHALTEPPVLAKKVSVDGGNGSPSDFTCYWARPDRKEPLPAIMLIYNDEKLTKWMEMNARQLASIGYAVLLVDSRWEPLVGDTFGVADREPQRRLSACMQWLRRREDVAANRLGVVGFGNGRPTLLFAGSRPVNACVVYDCAWNLKQDEIRGLRGTPVLIVHGAEEEGYGSEEEFAKKLAAERIPCKVHAAPKARSGFLGPPDSKAYNHDAAEDAWVAIYNFLEKYVEDAKPAEAVTRPAKSALTIADMMRAVNDPSGVRGTLSKALENEPRSARQWGHVRAHAALIAELGAWLETQAPPKGPAGHWQEQARALSAAAAAIVDAAERRDHASAQRRLAELAGKCAACHNEHR